jgi:hypothetical protein
VWKGARNWPEPLIGIHTWSAASFYHPVQSVACSSQATLFPHFAALMIFTARASGMRSKCDGLME